MAAASPEQPNGQINTPQPAPGKVLQPEKMAIESLLGGQLDDFLKNINRMSETAPGGPGEQGGGSGMQATGGTQGSTPVASARDQAIAALPVPVVMQKELEKHIRTEVKKLRKQAQRIARMNKPGAAHALNELYKSIRLLNALLAKILEASYDVLKRLFIRVFIDRQPIL